MGHKPYNHRRSRPAQFRVSVQGRGHGWGRTPAGAVVETRAILDGTGFRPLVSSMPRGLEAIVRPHVMREELTVEAAVEGSFEKALAALISDPLIGCTDIARPMLTEMLAATKEWLPQFDTS